MQLGLPQSSSFTQYIQSFLIMILVCSCNSRRSPINEVRPDDARQHCDKQQLKIQAPQSASWLKANSRDPAFIFGSTNQGIIWSEDFGRSWQTVAAADLVVPRIEGEETFRCPVDFKNVDLDFISAERQRPGKPRFCLITADRNSVFCNNETEVPWQQQTIVWPEGTKKPKDSEITQLHLIPSSSGRDIGIAILIENKSGPPTGQKIFLMHTPVVGENITVLTEQNRFETCEYSAEIAVLGPTFLGFLCEQGLDFFALQQLAKTSYTVNDLHNFSRSEIIPPLTQDLSLLIKTYNDESDNYRLFSPLSAGILRFDLNVPRSKDRVVLAAGAVNSAEQASLCEFTASRELESSLRLECKDMGSGKSIYQREVLLPGLIEENGLTQSHGKLEISMIAKSNSCWKLIISESSGSLQSYQGFSSCTEERIWQKEFSLSRTN